MSKDLTEGSLTLFHGQVCMEHDSTPCQGIQVTAEIFGRIVAHTVTDSNGRATLVVSDPIRKKELLALSYGYDLMFWQPWGDEKNRRRPIVVNRQGLYCEGRAFVNSPRFEIRFIRDAITQNEQNADRLKELTYLAEQVASRARDLPLTLVTGDPGSGKTTFLNLLVTVLQNYLNVNIFCHSFENDSSSKLIVRNLERHFGFEIDNRAKSADEKLLLLIDFFSELESSVIIVDGIDEVSNSGIDVGWREALKQFAFFVASGEAKSLTGGLHRMVVSSRNEPAFLSNLKDLNRAPRLIAK